MDITLDESQSPLVLPLNQAVWNTTRSLDSQGAPHEYHHLLVDPDLRDEKNRAVGGQAGIYQVPPDHSVYTKGGARTFQLNVQATRNHQTYGSGRAWSFHATLDEAKAQALIALAKQAKSYRKKYAT